jgi:hypothetical protein
MNGLIDSLCTLQKNKGVPQLITTLIETLFKILIFNLNLIRKNHGKKSPAFGNSKKPAISISLSAKLSADSTCAVKICEKSKTEILYIAFCIETSHQISHSE